MIQCMHLRIYTLLFILLTACTQSNQINKTSDTPIFEIAFMPDVHFHDLFADFESGSFEGLPVSYQGKNKKAVIRTMEAQLNSTRLFNENYFAFLAALDDIADRGIKYVALPGDFSDDGQPAHIGGLAVILNKYHNEHGISFFLTPGNHDPTRPFATEDGKRDYLGEGGKRQPVFSRNHPLCTDANHTSNYENQNRLPESHNVACTDEVIEMGYNGLYEILGDHGLMRQESYLYYETPFMDQNLSNDEPFLPENRIYEVCHEGTGGEYRKPEYTNCFDLPDMSYMVEPVEGVWLLALDTNVYIPRADANQDEIEKGENFYGSGNAGYNRVLTHKEYLLPWISDIARRAKEQGKMLISFSHFPAADFYNGAGPLIENTWGENEFQMIRMPEYQTTSAVAATGVGLHVAGHMHMNGLEITKDDQTGNVLTNIQVPSLAAYVPAYKIVRTFEDHRQIELETVVLNEIPDFDTLFPLYEEEWSYLENIDYERIWNRNILKSKTYLEFTDWHIRELSRLRFLPGEWPADLRLLLNNSSGSHLLIASFLPQEIWEKLTWSTIREEIDNTIESVDSSEDNDVPFHAALLQAKMIVERDGFTLHEFEQWNGETLSTDFYRIRNAGELALKHIPGERIIQYSVIAENFRNQSQKTVPKNNGSLYNSMHAVFEVLAIFSNRIPSDHVMIDLIEGKIKVIKHEQDDE